MTREEQQAIVETLLEVESGLTSWEIDFIESVGYQLEQGRTLSEKQEAVLLRIDEKIFGEIDEDPGFNPNWD